MLSEWRRILRESYKDRLRDILGGVGFTGHAKGRGVGEVNVLANQLGERSFRAVLREVAQ